MTLHARNFVQDSDALTEREAAIVTAWNAAYPADAVDMTCYGYGKLRYKAEFEAAWRGRWMEVVNRVDAIASVATLAATGITAQEASDALIRAIDALMAERDAARAEVALAWAYLLRYARNTTPPDKDVMRAVGILVGMGLPLVELPEDGTE